jgi:tRNA threonylcarbamoyladenosine biosynthesis protein TsaE
METMTLTDISELDAVAEGVLKQLQGKHGGAAAVLALHGDLGAGKTTFTQTLAKKLGIQDPVTSPTFVVMKNYILENQSFNKLVHIDAYRIEDVDEMRVLGFANLLEEKDTIICIEWAERIEALLPEQTLHMSIVIDGDARVISFNG